MLHILRRDSMLLRNKTVNEDCQNITDYKSELSIKEFALLLLADLASKSKIKYFSNENIKIACLNIIQIVTRKSFKITRKHPQITRKRIRKVGPVMPPNG